MCAWPRRVCLCASPFPQSWENWLVATCSHMVAVAVKPLVSRWFGRSSQSQVVWRAAELLAPSFGQKGGATPLANECKCRWWNKTGFSYNKTEKKKQAATAIINWDCIDEGVTLQGYDKVICRMHAQYGKRGNIDGSKVVVGGGGVIQLKCLKMLWPERM